MTKFVEAVLILSGMIIGVGMFGIPFSFAKAGFWLGAGELVILASVMLLFHRMYGEIVLHTPELHRLPGYVKIYLGSGAAFLSRFSALFGISGVLLAYILLGSLFLGNISQRLVGSSNEFLWAALFTAAGALVTLVPLKKAAVINGLLTGLLIIFILFLVVVLLPKVQATHLGGVHFGALFVPYGILLFSLSGGAVIPDVITFLGRERIPARRAITAGTIIPALLYFLFAWGVVGALGNKVSEEVIKGLGPVLGGGAVIFGSAIGFLAAFTSFTVLGSSFQAMLQLDFGLSRALSWLVGVLLPFGFYLLGLKDFIMVIGAVGALAVGIDSALVIASNHSMQKRIGLTPSPLSYLWRLGIYIMVVIGVLQELFKFF